MKQRKLDPDDEIVLTVSKDEYDQLDDAELLRRLRETAEVLTLEWLDKKLAEFP